MALVTSDQHERPAGGPDDGLEARVGARARAAVAAGAVAVISGALVLAPGGPSEQQAAAATLTPFEGCDQLRSWFVDSALASVGPYGLDSYGVGVGGAAVDMAASGAAESATAQRSAAAPQAAAADTSAVGPGATGTNVQEAGVDEPDLIKTDGSRVVLVRGDQLHVLDVTGDAPRELGKLTLPGGAFELLLSGAKALVLGSQWHDGPVPMASDRAVSSAIVAPGATTAVLTVVDLSDPSAPRVERMDEVEGSYVSAREHDGVVRVVVRHSPALPFLYPQSPGAEDEAQQHNRGVVTGSEAQDWLPKRVVRDDAGNVVSSEPLLECADVRHPNAPSGLGVVTVLTLDLTAPAEPAATAVTADGDLVYASTDRLYVATTQGGWFRPMPVEPGAAAVQPEEQTVRTQLHSFDVSGAQTSYVASGEVEGWLMGRWAMSEDDGRLRVATTRGSTFWRGETAEPNTDAAVTVLEEHGSSLDMVGSVGGLGKGEQIRAVRWFGDLATVVTFRQTDPLYTVDLSDPTTPKVLGELKVPGYSGYLHPLGDDLLLGVGQDATEEGQTLGVQVSTFDLGDLAAPARLDALGLRDTWSEVESDSRQFTYLPDLRVAYLPISGPDGSSLWAVRVGADGSLDEGGRWQPARDGWISRAIPVGTGRLAVLDEGMAGATLTLVSADGLGEIGSTLVAGNDFGPGGSGGGGKPVPLPEPIPE